MKSDVDKKLPKDLSEGIGRVVCILLAAVILTTAVVGLVLTDYMKLKTKSEMMTDKDHPEEPFRINFKLSLPALPRKFAMADDSDTPGTEKIDLTKNEGKNPMEFDLQEADAKAEDREQREPKHDEWKDLDLKEKDITSPIQRQDFERIVNHYPIVFVDFCASWSSFCIKLGFSWDPATREIHEKYPESDGRIRLIKVDCTNDEDFCRDHAINHYPTMRVFRNGHDDIYEGNRHRHEEYNGNRTTKAIVAFAESLVSSAGNPHAETAEMHDKVSGGVMQRSRFQVDPKESDAKAKDREQREPERNEWAPVTPRSTSKSVQTQQDFDIEDVNATLPIQRQDFECVVNRYPIVFVDFYASWCPFSKMLAPRWDAATRQIHEKYPESDGRIRLVKVDCTLDKVLCQDHAVKLYPTMRVFRNGYDDIYVGRHHRHEEYRGDRTTTAIVAFAESLVSSAGNPHPYHQEI